MMQVSFPFGCRPRAATIRLSDRVPLASVCEQVRQVWLMWKTSGQALRARVTSPNFALLTLEKYDRPRIRKAKQLSQVDFSNSSSIELRSSIFSFHYALYGLYLFPAIGSDTVNGDAL